MRRNPLAKEKFLEGIRQRWLAILLLLAGGVLVADLRVESFDPEPYLTFLTVIGPTFILGAAWDAQAKIRRAAEKKGAGDE